MSKLLSPQDFIHVIRCAPLVAIDLVVTDRKSRILLGKRVNAPARGHWFVPGGRIRKGETLEMAFERIATEELGNAKHLPDAQWVGVFTHLYPDNAFNVREEGGNALGTHYVVLAYRLVVDGTFGPPPCGAQHTEYDWFAPEALEGSSASREDMHPYLLPYLKAVSGNSITAEALWAVRGNPAAPE